MLYIYVLLFIILPILLLILSVLKMHQSRQLGREQTATWRSRWTGQGNQNTSSARLVPLHKCFATSSDKAALESHRPREQWETALGQKHLWSWKLWGLFWHLANLCLFQKWKGNVSVAFGMGGFGQRDAKAGFSLGFVIDLEMAGCSALVFVQTSPCQAPPRAALCPQLLPYLGLTPSTLSFYYSHHKDICQEIS